MIPLEGNYKFYIGIVFALLSQLLQPAWAGPRPNVVVILADDLGWRDVGYHGSEIDTPRIDALAEHGVILDRFYSQPTCSPSRAELMTGESALRLGVLSPMAKIDPAGLPLDRRLLPEYLRAQGYQTSMVGKWHLGYRQKPYLPTSRGFDHFYGNVTGGIGYWDHVHGGGLDWQRDGKTLREEGYSTHLLADEAVRIIENRNPDKPLFLYAAFNAPHLPNEAPSETIERYAGLDDHRRVHAAMVTELDTAVGRLIDSLAAEGMLENTLLWFMSDNGGLNPSAFSDRTRRVMEFIDRLFAGREVPIRAVEFLRVNVLGGGSDNRPFRMGKQTVYEGGVRVPSLLFWQGRLAAGKTDQMVTMRDVLPTLLAATGSLPRDTEFDGVDQWPLISVGSASQGRDFVVHAMGSEALYRFPWKLVSLSSGKKELYNIETDPTEKTDLAASEPELARGLTRALKAVPRGQSIHIPVYRSILDMDFFGGEETRTPWADQVQ